MNQTSIQWQEVRKRLQANEDSLRETLAESPERIRAIFRQRAVRLANERVATRPASNDVAVLIFRLAQERYAIALEELTEVLPFQDCIQVPGCSPQFLGVINLRGELRPVIDLARVLSGNPSIDSGLVLVLRRAAALKVDSVEDLREMGSEKSTCPVQGHYVKALASGTLALLDVEAVLTALHAAKEYRSI